MLFLVVSTPGPEAPSKMRPRRRRYWRWLAPLIAAGTARSSFARVGRGAVVLFDVESTETLHRLLNEWCEIVPARFDIYPLLEPEAAQGYLRATAGADG